MSQAVCILGATGSIGQSTLKILEQHPQRYTVFAVTAQSRIVELAEICKQYHPKVAVVPAAKVDQLASLLLELGLADIEILSDQAGLMAVAAHSEVDVSWQPLSVLQVCSQRLQQ